MLTESIANSVGQQLSKFSWESWDSDRSLIPEIRVEVEMETTTGSDLAQVVVTVPISLNKSTEMFITP